jgi:TPR repeat protein
LGECVEKNQDTAMKWFRLAAQQGHEDAKRYFH